MVAKHRLKASFAVLVALIAIAVAAPVSASAKCSGGGLSASKVDVCTPTAKAKLLKSGILVAPKSAPKRVKRVIAAANRISRKPYVYGGGHARWWDRGYDCSGAVSFALRGGKFLDSPLPSGALMDWGMSGKGRWITVYAHGGHTYAVIAGFRWDTSGDNDGETGPRWHADKRSPAGGGYVARHPAGF